MDFQNITLVGLFALGAVNVVTFFKPNLDSRLKFTASFVIAFLVAFIPENIGNIILQNAKIALQAAFAASGVYVLAKRAGGK